MDPVRVLCLRHGESQNVIAGAVGALPSAPLTQEGRRQAARAARVLEGEQITWVYASTAVRAQETAGVIARGLGLVVTALPELVEVGLGVKEGATDAGTRARTAEVLHAWVVRQDLSQRVADGEDGHRVIGRVTDAFTAIAAAHPGETVALVGHVASLTAGLSALCGLGHRVWGAPLPHAVPFLVERDGRGWRCRAWPGRGRPPVVAPVT